MISTRGSAGGVRGRVALALLCGVWLLAVNVCAAGESAPLRRAIVPAAAQERWPAGEWVRVPYADYEAFAHDHERGDLTSEGPPLIDRLIVRAALAEGTLIEGSFAAQLRRFAPESSFLDLGRPTGAIRNLQWGDGAAAWGTAPDTRLLLYVDRAAGTCTGEWSQRGEPSPVGTEFDVRTFPAASIRLELALPPDYELQATRGVVLPPGAGGSAADVWAVELGQHAGCLCTVVRRSDTPPIVAMSVERTASWTIRPDGCRLHADFNISIPATAPATLEFAIPDGLQNPEATTSANVSLPVEVDRRSTPPRLVVPLPRLAAGRLGIIRVSGDLPLRERGDWELPDVRLENSTVVSSVRRIHVDRPLKLLSFELEGARQSGINIDDAGGDWTFEDTAADARVTVRVGQPPAALVVRAVTLVNLSPGEARFRTAAELRSRGGGEYLAELLLPPDWSVIEVGPAAGDRAGLTSWRATAAPGGIRLEIAFRQALSAQSPRYVIISGRRVGPASADHDIDLFPMTTPQDEVRSWLGIRHDSTSDGTLIPRDGAQRFVAADGPADWARLTAMLEAPATDPDWSWFGHAEKGAGGSVGLRTPSTANTDPNTSTLSGRPASDIGPAPGPFSMELLLDTDLGGPDSEWLQQRADYSLSGRLPDQPPQIRLPAGARFDRIAIDGQPQNVVVANDVIELLDWPQSPRSVQVWYRTRNAGIQRWLTRDVTVLLPEWNTPPRTVEWRLHLSSAEGLAGVHVPNSAVQPRPGDDWLQRAFGPLARNDWRETANPFSMAAWVRRFTGNPRARRDGVVSVCTAAPQDTLRVELADLQSIQRASWLAVLGAALTAGLLRLCSRRGATIVWFAVLTLLLAASLLPYVPATLCGAALAGGLTGAMLPRRWINPAWGSGGPTDDTPAGMQRARHAVGAGLLLLSAWNTGLYAQPAPTEQERAGAVVAESPAVEFDVLLPEDDGAPADHALIQRRLLPQFEQWRRTRRRDPAYLLQSAQYALESGATPHVRVRFRVAIFDQRRRLPLLLPFARVWVQDPDACLVDGQPGQIRPASEGDALLVELEPASSAADTTVRMSEVELTLRLSTSARTDSGWEFEAPGVLDAQLSLPAGNRLTADSHQATRLDEGGRPVFDLGGRTSIAVRPEEASTSVARRTLSAEAVSLIEVHPLRLRVRTSLIPSSRERDGLPAGPQRLRLQLPERSDVREVAVSGLRSYAVRHPRRDVTLVDLELEQFPEPDAPIHLDFTIPVQQPQDAIVIPPLTVLGDGRLLNHRIGLRASPGIVLDPPSPAELPATLSEIPAAMFSAGLNTGTAWPIPSHVYVAASPAALTVASHPASPAKAAILKQSVSINAESLHWEATVEVDVSIVPAYRHVFQLSPGMQLDVVQLSQDEVGRLLDWSHDGDQLVLSLAGDRIGKQQIRLSGSMNFDPAQLTRLPEFTIRDATVTSSELIIRSTPTHPIELFDDDGAPLPAEHGAATGGAVQFSQPDAELPAAFRFLPAPAPLAVSVVTTIDRRDGRWQMLTEVLPDRTLGPAESIPVDVPAAALETITPVAPAAITRAGDGTLRLSWDPAADGPAASPLAFLMPLTAPEQGDWQPPRVRFPTVNVADEVAVIPAEFPLAPVPGAAETVEPEMWPPAARARRGADATDRQIAVFRWNTDEPRFEQRRAADGTPDVRLIESAVWRETSGAIGGETVFWLVALQDRCKLRFDWSPGAQFQAATWDARTVEPLDVSADAVELRIDGLVPGSVHCLRISWNASAGAGGSIWEPRWPHATQAPRFAAVLPRDGYILMPPRGQLPRAETLSLRADTLLDLYTEALKSTNASTLATIAHEIEALLEALGTQSPLIAGPLQSRWDSLRSNEPADVAMSHPHDAPSLMAAAWGDARVLPLNLTADSSAIHYWELHAGLTAAAVGVAGLLAVTLCLRFRRLFTGRRGRLAVDPEALRLLALGALWWMWLKFGLLGLLLIGSAAWLQRRARLQASAQPPNVPL